MINFGKGNGAVNWPVYIKNTRLRGLTRYLRKFFLTPEMALMSKESSSFIVELI
jgi:hypothetical protein